jgi:hypothetical protein
MATNNSDVLVVPIAFLGVNALVAVRVVVTTGPQPPPPAPPAPSAAQRRATRLRPGAAVAALSLCSLYVRERSERDKR